MPLKFTLFSLVAALLLASPALADTIRLGVTAGPHAQIAEALQPIAAAKGLTVQIVSFSDGSLIDSATDDGELDANAFQHTPYLDQQNKDRGLHVVAVGGPTVLLPMAAYSHKVKTLNDLAEGAQISIPNDPTNAGRALKMLEAEGLLKLRDGVGFDATELDITENPKKLRILPMDTAQLPRSLDDVAASVITSWAALAAGLKPSSEAIAIEGRDSAYFCLIGVAQKNEDAPWVKTLVEAYKSPEVKAFIEKTFAGNVVTSW